MRLRALAMPLAGAVLVACAAITGASDLRIGEVDDGRDAGDAGPEPEPEDSGSSLVSCGDQRVCLGTPSGWTPVALVQGAANVVCPTTYAQKASLKGVSALAKCNCRCGGAAGPGSCDGDVRFDWGNATCTLQATNLTVNPDGGCSPVATGAVSQGAKAGLLAPTVCAPQISQEMPQPVDVAVCSGAETTTSPICRSGESCVPAVARGTRLCIARDGEVACPDGPWTRWSAGTSPTDDRACSQCTCGTDATECAKGTLTFYADTACATAAVGRVPTDDKCAASVVTGEPRAAQYKPGTGCTVTKAPTLTGALAFQGARTVCCTP